MSKILVHLLILCALIGAPMVAQTVDGSMAEATAAYSEWMDVLAEFTRGVEFDEGDVRDVLDYWAEMNELEVLSEEDESDSAAEFAMDVREILASSEYQTWARGNGLDPEDWLRKSMRLSTVLMAQEMAAQQEMMVSQRESYAAMVEESCAQVDEEACQQMRAAMSQSMAVSEAMTSAVAKLPPPTAGEAALLDQYGTELQAVMMADDEQGYEDYDSDYDEEYDEEYGEDDG